MRRMLVKCASVKPGNYRRGVDGRCELRWMAEGGDLFVLATSIRIVAPLDVYAQRFVGPRDDYIRTESSDGPVSGHSVAANNTELCIDSTNARINWKIPTCARRTK